METHEDGGGGIPTFQVHGKVTRTSIFWLDFFQKLETLLSLYS